MHSTASGDTASRGKKRSFRNIFKLHGRPNRPSTASPPSLSHEDVAPPTPFRQTLSREWASRSTLSKWSTVTTDQAETQDEQSSPTIKPQTSGPLRVVTRAHYGRDAVSSLPNAAAEVEQSLWDHAYSNLMSENAELLEDYETLLMQKLLPETTGSAASASDSTRNSLTSTASVLHPSQRHQPALRISEPALEKQWAKGKICIAGYMISVRDILNTIGETVKIAKDWIDDAAQASPRVSVAWSIVCLALPLLTKPINADTANHGGFTYISSQMLHYIAMEKLIQPEEHITDLGKMQGSLESRLLHLYQRVLEFQIKSILLYHRTTSRTIISDIRDATNWGGILRDIQDTDKTLYQDLLTVSTNTSGNLPSALLRTTTENRQRMESLLERANQYNHSLVENLQQFNHRESIQKEKDCLQVLCLDPPYSDFKEVIHDRVEGTCMWFLSQRAYKDWVTRPDGHLLVSADPGCGKSVLAKFLVDSELPRSCPDAIICYFFFKDQVQNTLCMALCGFLHQLLVSEPRLIKHAQAKHEKYGLNLRVNAQALFDIITDALADPISTTVIFVLDALDECHEKDREKLFRFSKILQAGSKQSPGKLKILLTSRPYDNIIYNFESELPASTSKLIFSRSVPQDQRCPARIHIPGELESETISQEVNIVIKNRLQDLYERGKFKEDVRIGLEKRLLRDCNRTYLWVYLLFEELQYMIKPTWKETERKLATLPTSVNEAYEKILSRCITNEEIKGHTIRTLCVLLVAQRSLSLREVQCAVKVRLNPPSSTFGDLNLEKYDNFATKLRNWCGLLIQIYRGRVTFIHQTVRGFLLDKEVISSQASMSVWRWQGFVQLEFAHSIVGQCCLVYLHLQGPHLTELHDQCCNSRSWPDRKLLARFNKRHEFMSYAAQYWDYHFIYGHCQTSADLLAMARNVCDPAFPANTVWRIESHRLHDQLNWVSAAARLDSRLYSALLAKNAHNDPIPQELYDQALSEAIRLQHSANLDLILSHGANPDIADDLGRTALHRDISLGCCRVLLEHGAQLDLQDQLGQTPLTRAFLDEDFPRTKLLLRRGANLAFRRFIFPLFREIALDVWEPFSSQLSNRSSAELKLEAEIRLFIATICAGFKTIQLLLKHGIKSNSQDLRGHTVPQFPLKPHRASDTMLPLLSDDVVFNIPDNTTLKRRFSISETSSIDPCFLMAQAKGW